MSKTSLLGRGGIHRVKNGCTHALVGRRKLLESSLVNALIQPENLIIASDLMARKKLMIEMSDGYLALPGGIGTLDELHEVSAGAQLGLHSKPVAALNIAGFFGHLVALYEHQQASGFLTHGQALGTRLCGLEGGRCSRSRFWWATSRQACLIQQFPRG